ncbi:MAG: hypothetical protein AMXMBFR33_08580 [Candidatus Xenobia bacterium]|jgi:hypothetical protein
MIRILLCLLLGVLTLGCSAERRDVIRYFEAIIPHEHKLREAQSRMTQISALPFEQRAQAYRSLADESRKMSEEIGKIRPPEAVAGFHQQFLAAWQDFVTFNQVIGDVVDLKLTPAQRDEASKKMQTLQAAWPAKMDALRVEEQRLGKAFGIDFQ